MLLQPRPGQHTHYEEKRKKKRKGLGKLSPFIVPAAATITAVVYVSMLALGFKAFSCNGSRFWVVRAVAAKSRVEAVASAAGENRGGRVCLLLRP